jgi:hypothetical protein
MATEVSKYSVFDPRIVQTKPKYAVEKGALSLTNVSFQAQTADSSAVQFNVLVPSENVFVDRAIEWTGSLCATVSVKLTNTGASAIPAGTSLQGLVGPGAFPLHQACTQMISTINDASVTVNTLDVLPQVMRLADMRDARRQRTCPTMLDRYATYPDSRVVKNTPLGQWDQNRNSDEVPNGGFNGFYYCTSATFATPQPALGAGTAVSGVSYLNGQPYLTAQIAAAASVTVSFYVVVRSTEKLMLPPFIFADEDELSTGLFGVQNFQVQMNLAPSSNNRSFRVSKTFSAVDNAGVSTALVDSGTAPTVTLATLAGGCWLNQPRLAVQFLTPSLDIPLPPKSIVPYMEFPRYITIGQSSVVPSTNYLTAGTSLQSQTITLPNIPDLLMIFVKPASYAQAADAIPLNGDWSLPITNISLNFDNFSGLLASQTREQLYQMSVHNGVDMDWSEWTGLGATTFSTSLGSLSGVPSGGGLTGLVGGPLVLRPGRDFALQTGQAPGLVGNFTLQYNITVQNFTGATQDVNIYTVPISSGFFETIKGSSRIIKGVLTEQDILGAPSHAPEPSLERPVGAGKLSDLAHQARVQHTQSKIRNAKTAMSYT